MDLNNTLEYVERQGDNLIVTDPAGETIILEDYNSTTPSPTPHYTAENVANKRNNLLNPNSTTYPTTFAVSSALSGFTFESITGVTNIGSGVGIYSSIINQNIKLKSLIGGNNVILSATTDNIIISFNSSGVTGYLKIGDFNSFTGTTLPANYYNKTEINTYTGATRVELNNIENNIQTISGTTIYNLASPATVNVGGITVGTILTGKSTNEILKEILVPYILPSVSSFGVNINNIVEVGCNINGLKSFSWSFNTPTNVQDNTLCIIDVSNSTILATNISTISPQNQIIANKTFNSCGDSQMWNISLKNTCNNQFNSGNYTVTSLLPYYWGKCTCAGPAGDNRPIPTSDMITGGSKVLSTSNNSININFNSGNDDYLWFAVPATVSNKICWCVNALNNGTIGGGVSPACNLFPSPTTIDVSSACWNNCSYKVFISNKQTSTTLSMTIC